MLLKVFLLLRILLVNFQNQLMFSSLHFLPGLLFLTEGLRVSGYDEDVAILASKSLKPGTCRQFQSGWGKFGRHFAADKLRHEDVPTSSFGNFLGREFFE